MAGMMSAIFGAISGAGKGISNSANTAIETGSGNREVGADTTTNANGGENAATGAVEGYTGMKLDHDNKNNVYSDSSESASSNTETSEAIATDQESKDTGTSDFSNFLKKVKIDYKAK